MPMPQTDQELLGKLLVASTCVLIRSDPAARKQVVEILARDHQNELVEEVTRRALAA